MYTSNNWNNGQPQWNNGQPQWNNGRSRGETDNAYAIICLILSIVGFATGFIFIGVVLDIAAIILAIVCLCRKSCSKGMVITAIVISGLSIFLTVALYCSLFLCRMSGQQYIGPGNGYYYYNGGDGSDYYDNGNDDPDYDTPDDNDGGNEIQHM